MVEIFGNKFLLGGNQWPITQAQFRHSLARHIASDPTTEWIERYARAYVRLGYPLDRTKALISAICRWGGNQRQRTTQVLNNAENTVTAMRRYLIDAHQALLQDQPRIALENIMGVKRLGISYGSKHLRFLSPNRAVILDSVIRKKLGYANTSASFERFLEDCVVIRDELNQRHITTGQRRARWRLADVEMAIFAKAMPIKKLT